MKWPSRMLIRWLYFLLIGLFLTLPPIAPSATLTIAEESSLLQLDSITGSSGETVIVSLSLENGVAVKGLQFDLVYNHEALRFDYLGPVNMGSALTAISSQIDPASHRFILYLDDESTLPSDAGVIAHLFFSLPGPVGVSEAIDFLEVILSDPDGFSLPVTASGGDITITAPATEPELHLAILRNPGQRRSLQILLTSNQRLESLPVVTAGTSSIEMALQDPSENLFYGNLIIPVDIQTLQIDAVGTNGLQTGTATKTITIGK